MRARIIGWGVVLAAIGTLATGFTAYSLQLDRVDTRINNALDQETEEFSSFLMSRGTRWTSEDFPTLERLFDAAERGNVGGRFETFIGLVGTDVVSVAGRPIDLTSQPDLLQTLTDNATAGGIERGTAVINGTDIVYAAIPVRVEGPDQTGTYLIVNDSGAQHDEAVAAAIASAAVALLGLIVLGGVGWWLSGRLLRPVRLLRDAITHVSDADFSQRIPVHGTDDISMLAQTFNGMVDKLDDAFTSQRRFLDDASHELRTPITILRGHLELLDPTDTASATRTIEMLVDELDRMKRLVDDITLLATSARPGFITDEPIEADRFIDDVADKARSLGQRRWTVEQRQDVVFHGDKQRLTQALLQLAHNAVKHTADGDRITFGAQSDGAIMRLWVRDSGTGIDPTDADRIFERFARARTGRSTEGSGLGLSIVTAIAENHGGTVRLISEPGLGSTFTIEVPAHLTPLDPSDHSNPVTTGGRP